MPGFFHVCRRQTQVLMPISKQFTDWAIPPVSWVSLRGRDSYLASSFYMQIFSSLNIIIVNFVFSTMYTFGALVENKVTRYTSTSLFLDLLLYSIGLRGCSCGSAMLSLSLWSCSTIWGQLLWYLRHFSSWLEFLFVIHRVLYFHLTFGIFFPLVLWTCYWNPPVTCVEELKMNLRLNRTTGLKSAFTIILWSFYLDSSEYRVQSRDRETQRISCFFSVYVSLLL